MNTMTKAGIFTIAVAVLLSANGQAQPRGEETRGDRDKRPPRHGRHPEPVQFSNHDERCAVIYQKDFCLGGDIASQLSKTPINKVATYGLKDVYQSQQQKGGQTTLYVIDGKIANILTTIVKPQRKPPEHRQSRRPERHNRPDRSLLGAVFRIADRYSAQFGQDKGREAIDQILKDIQQKGFGGHTWTFAQWSFYAELTSDGSVLAEAWIPALENQEKQAKKLKTGDVLSGLWHNEYPVELYVKTRQIGGFKGFLRFTQAQDNNRRDPVEIKQLAANTLEVVRIINDGTRQRLISRQPKGTAAGCYIWEMLLQDSENPDLFNIDGQLKLCRAGATP